MDKTLGQIAYEAAAKFMPSHRRIYADTPVDKPWGKLQVGTQQIYEAAAQAVVERCIEEMKKCRPGYLARGPKDDDWHDGTISYEFAEAIECAEKALRSLMQKDQTNA